MWADLQEAFYILMAPYVVGLLLPVFAGAAILLAVLMTGARWWRPLERISVLWSRDTLDDAG